MHRIGLDVKWYDGRVTKTVVDTEIEEAIDNDCDTLVLVCANGWTSGAENAADDEEEVDVYLVYPPDDMRELEAY
mgnify:CR=1 FL=1